MSKRSARPRQWLLAGPVVFAVWMPLPAAQAAGAGQPSPSEAATPFVAGLAPDRRPELVPIPNELVRDDGWRARALKGVSEPIPASLKFIDDQGGWYNPFLKPGMPGRYDIRGRHSASGQK